MAHEEQAMEALEQYIGDMAYNISRLEHKLTDYRNEYAEAVEALNAYKKREEYKKCMAKGAGK